MRGREVNWGAMQLTGVFEATDGALVMVGAFKANPLRDIGLSLGIEGIDADARFASHQLQGANKAALQDLFRARFKTNSTAHWLGKLEAEDLLCAPVLTLAEALVDEQTAVNGMI